jgi:hypothetical protein
MNGWMGNTSILQYIHFIDDEQDTYLDTYKKSLEDYPHRYHYLKIARQGEGAKKRILPGGKLNRV